MTKIAEDLAAETEEEKRDEYEAEEDAEIVDATTTADGDDDDDLEHQLTLHFALRAMMRTLFATAWQLEVEDISVIWLSLEKEALYFGLDAICLEKSFVDFNYGKGRKGGGGGGGRGERVGGVNEGQDAEDNAGMTTARTTKELRIKIEDFILVYYRFVSPKFS